MMTDKEFQEKIEQVCTDFVGQIDDLYAAVGMMQVGRLYGWKVMRLATTARIWSVAASLFGDPKLILPERGVLAKKSIGLKYCDRIDEYWKVVKRHVEIPPGLKKEVA